MPFWKLIGCLLIFSVSKFDVSMTQVNRTFMMTGVKFTSCLDRILMSHSDLVKFMQILNNKHTHFLKGIV